MSESGLHTKLVGHWVTVSSTNLEELLQVLGAPYFIRKVAPLAKPAQKIWFEGLSMIMQTEAGFMSKKSVVPIDGTEYKDEMFQHPLVATAEISETGAITLSGKLGEEEITITREVNDDDQMVLTINVRDVEFVRKSNRKQGQ